MNKIEYIGFDADDTLWINEDYFREARSTFSNLLKDYLSQDELEKEFIKTEIKNIPLYGYGIKGFVLSMLEFAYLLDENISASITKSILEIGKEMTLKPVILLKDVEAVISRLSTKYKLILLTKGDLIDQERKLKKSNLKKYFSHIKILSEKNKEKYLEYLNEMKINIQNFVMVGNSPKSDINPFLELGCTAFHIPYKTTWELENVQSIQSEKLIKLKNMRELENYLSNMS